jgi:hypothetical protein
MKRIKYIILTLGLVAGVGLAVLPTTARALDVFTDACKPLDPNNPNDPNSPSGTAVCKGKDTDKATPFIGTLVNMLLYVLGAVSVIVIIFAGIFYATSGGDATLITKAKNTLLYAVVGLVVAMLAYAIVNYVLNQFKV